ncbi:hypothetical protein JMJ77_0005650 [Colletotrichum scovillei]|uniref:Uncharacterized protein n=1 Tax=Colletotrichum scovillei TaxID=1209932 RepID=A0A9P7RJF8_9PEZI|nr:hypothetical protein JMJ77_0005650 [Colletotrichum scovillei]KAG7076828.1 hypothetical protein JMJ76_0014087 [Colletotrichum scovillei]KAG7083966.1 hypothetical protein JMJ78_0009406 [Colletotrichum scovillei]
MITLFLAGFLFAWYTCAAQVPRLVTVNSSKANMTMTAATIQSGAILGRQLRDPNICGYVATHISELRYFAMHGNRPFLRNTHLAWRQADGILVRHITVEDAVRSQANNSYEHSKNLRDKL